MGSVFALLTTVPGHERELLDRLATFPGVQQRQLLFGQQIALRLDERQLPEAPMLGNLAGVKEARLYHDHDSWVIRAQRVIAGS